MAGDTTILILQHIACEPPAAYEDELVARGLDLHRVRMDEGDELPSWRAFAGIVVMGGPMGTYDEATYPWLATEKQFIERAVRAGTPYWGICLGAQLLAASLGGMVTPGPRPEAGVGPVQLTEDAANDPVFSSAPPLFDALHWHGDTYELPAGAIRLASSERYEQQAFVFERAYALQFHLEVDAVLAEEWTQVPAYLQSLEEVMGVEGPPRLLEQVARTSAGTIRLARALFGRWLDHVVGLAPERGRGVRESSR
jgi:GMP synthase (glutamine-hydrolysing)